MGTHCTPHTILSGPVLESFMICPEGTVSENNASQVNTHLQQLGQNTIPSNARNQQLH